LVLGFSAEDWLLSVGLGVTSSIVQISKNKALQYEEPARLGALMYLQSVLQLLLDVLFLQTRFSP
jgi:drug/metabolite transporter (DMT)-like permease